jgi:hypothetical protein
MAPQTVLVGRTIFREPQLSPFLDMTVCDFHLPKTKSIYNPCTQEVLQIGIWNINVENMVHEVQIA